MEPRILKTRAKANLLCWLGGSPRRTESQPIHVLRLSLRLCRASALSRAVAPAPSLSSWLIGASPPLRRSPYVAPQCSSDCLWTHTSPVLLCERNFFSVLTRKSLLNYVPHATCWLVCYIWQVSYCEQQIIWGEINGWNGTWAGMSPSRCVGIDPYGH